MLNNSIALCLIVFLSATTLKSKGQSAPLFENDEVLDITLSGNLKDLLNDRAETPSAWPVSISYLKPDSSRVSLSIQAKTRGHFRKQKGVCTYPPLLLQFPKNESQAASIFSAQKNLKLVMPCSGDEYVVREWLVYKLYNLVTPKSFRARLVRVTLDDEKKKKATAPFYGILLEEEDQVAARNHMVAFSKKLRPEQAEYFTFLHMAAFEYLIGNTDWSVQYLQNIKLLGPDTLSIPITVPYDFDHAGIVSTPYAKPADELELASVRDRRYRGYCISDMKQFDSTVTLYNRIKPEIYRTYSECRLVDPKYIRSTLQYLDDFYATINNPKALQKEFGYPCDKNGTGNIIIQGMKKDQ